MQRFLFLILCFPVISIFAQDTNVKKNALAIGYGFDLKSKNGFFDFSYQRKLNTSWSFGARVNNHQFRDGSYLAYHDLTDTTVLKRTQWFENREMRTQFSGNFHPINNVSIGFAGVLGVNRIYGQIHNEILQVDTSGIDYTYTYDQRLSWNYEYVEGSPNGGSPAIHTSNEMVQIISGLGVNLEVTAPIINQFEIVFRYNPELVYYSTISNRSIYKRDDLYITELPNAVRFNHYASVNARLKF